MEFAELFLPCFDNMLTGAIMMAHLVFRLLDNN